MNPRIPKTQAIWNPLRIRRAAICIMLAAHTLCVVYVSIFNSPTMNEPGHLVAGIAHWKYAKYDIYHVTPPLVHYVASAPLFLIGFKEDWSQYFITPDGRPEYALGNDFINANEERSMLLFSVARIFCIPFSIIGALICYAWSSHLFRSYNAGLISLFLWCSDPNIIAHAGLITGDIAATSMVLLSGYSFWRWLGTSKMSDMILAGIFLGIALLSKLSMMILLGCYPLIFVLWELLSTTHNLGVACLRAVHLSLLMCIAIQVLNLGYCYQGSLVSLSDYTFVSNILTGESEPRVEGNRFRNSWLSRVPVPFPYNYVKGIDRQQCDFESYAANSYLCGEWREKGWWYFYIYAFAVKTPHGTQALIAFGLYTIVYFRLRNNLLLVRNFTFLLVPIALFVVASMQTEFTHHARYVLPCYGFGLILSGASAIWDKSRFVNNDEVAEIPIDP